MLQQDLPKSILKSSIGYTKNLCTKVAELQTAKLTKPVLKRESEESEQPAILSNSEMSLRSILKSNLNLKPIQIANDATTSKSEGNSCDNESQNQSSETAKFREGLDDSSGITTSTTQHNLQYICDDTQAIVSKKSDNVENRATVPSHKTAIFQNEKILLNDINNCNIDTISNNRILMRRDDKWHNNLSIDKSNRVSDLHNDNDNDNNDNEDNEKDADDKKEKGTIAELNVDDDDQGSSSSNDYEVHNIIENEKHTDVTQCLNSLTKNIHQHLRDNERREAQQRLEQPCRSAITQVIASIETSETPNVSIADRLAALRHSGNTSWKQRVADGKTNESFDKLLSAEENTMLKSGVLAGCIEKLESSMESWKSRIAMPDAVNFTVAGKMKVVQSKDENSSFLTDTVANISNQKKKVPRPQRFKTRKGKKRERYLISNR